MDTFTTLLLWLSAVAFLGGVSLAALTAWAVRRANRPTGRRAAGPARDLMPWLRAGAARRIRQMDRSAGSQLLPRYRRIRQAWQARRVVTDA